MNPSEKIYNLVERVKKLPYRDKKELDCFVDEAKAVIEEIFGEPSAYLEDLKMLRFSPNSFYSTSEEYEESWEHGVENTLRFLNRMIEDPLVGGTPVAVDEVTVKAAIKNAIESSGVAHATGKTETQTVIKPMRLARFEDEKNTDLSIETDEPRPPRPIIEEGAKSEKTVTDPNSAKKPSKPSSSIDELYDRMKEDGARQVKSVFELIGEQRREEERKKDEALRQKIVEHSQQVNFSTTIKDVNKTVQQLFHSFNTATHSLTEKLKSRKKPETKTIINKMETNETPETEKNEAPKPETKAEPTKGAEPTKEAGETPQPEQTAAPETPQKEAEPAKGAEPAEPKIDDFVLPKQAITSSRVYVVHNQAETMRNTLVDTLAKLGLEAVDLGTPKNFNKTMQQKAAEFPDVNFAIILLSNDDLAYPKNSKPLETTLMQTNQKIVFEMGYWIGKLGRDRVFVLYHEKENYRRPTEFFDAYYCDFDKKGNWIIELAKKLEACEFKVKKTK